MSPPEPYGESDGGATSSYGATTDGATSDGATTSDDANKPEKTQSNQPNTNPTNINQRTITKNDDVRTVQDLVTAKPPSFKARIHNYFFQKGMALRPPYLQEIYKAIPRTVYVNQDLPTDMVEDGRPIVQYPRNKIRTTKYTPLSFIPKNLLLQFRNVANTYFLIMVILSAIEIFGVPLPGLAAVPLIVIVCITAIKDAFEDYSRGLSDSDLNNLPVHLLVGLQNPNVLEDDVSSWRRFKKACLKIIAKILKALLKAIIYVFGTRYRKDQLRLQLELEEAQLRRVSTIVSEDSNYGVPGGRRSNAKGEEAPDEEIPDDPWARHAHHANRNYEANRNFEANRNSFVEANRSFAEVNRSFLDANRNSFVEGNRNSFVDANRSRQSIDMPGRASVDSPFNARNSQSRSRPRKSMASPRASTTSRVGKTSKTAPPNTILNPRLIETNRDLTTNVSFKNRRWKDVSVGSIIRIGANEEVPADVVILLTADAEGNCYVETKNLDGETNLKNKTSLNAGGSSHLKHSRDFLNTKFWIECDAPNPALYSFKGTIHYEHYDEKGSLVEEDEKEPITNANVLLRGCTVRNVKWVIGIVIYTGSETKIMLNSGITPTKVSLISRQLNLLVIINFVLLFILCLVSAVVNGVFYTDKHVSRLYYEFQPYASTAAANGVIAFFVTLIIYQSLVPISLYISVEIIKTLQAFFIFSDVRMYYDRLDFPCLPKAWNISDDLGQIEYVFSDKTGTLTQNVMEFKKCTIAGKAYGKAYTEAKQGVDKRNGVDVLTEIERWKHAITDDQRVVVDELTSRVNNDQFRADKLTFVSLEYVNDTILADRSSKQKEANEEFMLALALCHTVVTEPNAEDPDLRDFKAELPDEAALVAVARDMGIVFAGRARQQLTVNFYGEPLQYEMVDTIPFTSLRKRMSCIVRTPANRYLLITKGADNVIFLRLDKQRNSRDTISRTALHLEDFANEGLRTLCIAQRELDADFYKDWSRRYAAALASIDDSRDDIIAELDEEIERDLILLGGTAIEDRLQLGVPDAIGLLAQAGIKLWVLTGDRIETAINIGFSCNLLGNDMKLLVVRPDENDPENLEYVDSLVTKYLAEEFGVSANSPEDINGYMKTARKDHSTPESQHALVIDGAALALVFRDLSDVEDPLVAKLQEKFLLLGKQCRSVICCRVSPAQKALVVKLVKNSLDVMTLAIGDGANDVAMIQAANIGVGIAGEEGRQAVMSSDYAIGQFRYLARLLLVHGRWSYKRLAEMVPCFFYKNVVFTLTCFFYGIFNNFDGSYLYEYTFLMFYNLAFTSLTVIVLAVLDQDVSDTVSLLVPQLYRLGILGQEWSQYKFAWYMFDGLYQSVICFFFPWLLYRLGFQNPQGLAVDHRFWMGTVVIMIAVTACNLYVLLRQYRWDWLSLLIYAISILLVFFWTGAWSALPWIGEYFKAGAQVLGTLSCWCCFFVGVIGCLLPRFTYDFILSNFRPRDIDIIREQVRQGVYDKYPGGYDPTDLEGVEKFRILNNAMEQEPSILEKMDSRTNHENKLQRTFKSIRRHTPHRSSQSRRNTISRSQHASLTRKFLKPINLDDLRAQMAHDGDYGADMKRINTTHELPGLTQAETLISYHTRTSGAGL